MKVIKQKRIFRQDLRNNPHVAFIFGDNTVEGGYGGQAKEMRGEPNAFGIPTKWIPSMDSHAFFQDKDYDIVTKAIDVAIQKVIDSGHKIVVIPEDGIGTGRARLHQTAPLIFQYLQDRLKDLEKI